MYNYLISNNLIFNKQVGSWHSTVYQFIDLYHQIIQPIDTTNLYARYILLHFQSLLTGYDTKLKGLGITGRRQHWISEYLNNIHQRVIVGQSFSSYKPFSAGVPQWSVIVPLLFRVYVNDITETLASTTRLFADDTSMALTSSHINDLQVILNHDLEMIFNWSKQWLATFNPNKTLLYLRWSIQLVIWAS